MPTGALLPILILGVFAVVLVLAVWHFIGTSGTGGPHPHVF